MSWMMNRALPLSSSQAQLCVMVYDMQWCYVLCCSCCTPPPMSWCWCFMAQQVGTCTHRSSMRAVTQLAHRLSAECCSNLKLSPSTACMSSVR